jgi:hypothetical protein
MAGRGQLGQENNGSSPMQGRAPRWLARRYCNAQRTDPWRCGCHRLQVVHGWPRPKMFGRANASQPLPVRREFK